MDKRPYYNKGTCLNLKTSPYMLFLFVDDDESHWSDNDISNYWYNNVELATSFIENEAKRYHYDIKIDKGYYASGVENLKIKYDGVVKTVLEGPIQYDIIDQVASCLGFESKFEMHSWLKQHTHNEQIGYVVVLNKEGHSHCVNTDENDFDKLEFVFQFVRHTGQDIGYPAALAHEILHLFGAEDCYDPFGKMPKRKELASNLYPHDIMVSVYTDITANKIDEFSAYTIGWLDNIPKECDVKEWWEKDEE